METFLGRFRNLIVLAAILFAQLIGLAMQVRRPSASGDARLVRVWAVSAVSPFESAAVHSQNWVRNLWTNYAYLRGVRRENRELRAEIARMKIEDARLDEDARMARRVQSLLAFKEQYVDSTLAAQVIGTSGSDQSRVIYIDKGSADGIKPEMAVITPTGIVGKVSQVYTDSAQVLTINDQFSGVGAALKDSRLQGILKGAPNGATTLQYIMSDEKVTPGEDVITSGGDRIFPKGLPVGKVVSVAPGKDLFLNIRVVPSANLDRLEEVLIVTKITEKMPDVHDLGPLRASDILAERLPGVPNKANVDASGNAKPDAANGAAQPGTAPSGAAANPTRPLTSAAASPAKPTANGGAIANKPSATPGAAPATKKPAAAAGAAAAPKAKLPAQTVNRATGGTKPAPAARPEENGATTPTPAPDMPPATQPAAPSAGATPQ